MINKINALLKEVERKRQTLKNWRHYALNISAKKVKYLC